MEGLSASAAFWDHLRTLCLNQFPCGVGSWNKSRFPPRLPPRIHGLPAPKPAPVRRYGLLPPNEETVEALTDFLRCPDSPWALPPDCSPPEEQLRELAVLQPRIIQPGFVCCFFRSLRIVNKGVTEIDVGLLKFPNLEELILTANHIRTIPAANLPPGLKVLELCGNEVQSLRDLCTSPPPTLQHLGLGHNCQLGSSEEQYLATVFWPNLVSLDLSYNNFTNLLSLLSKLCTLKKLRILILQGNPFALLPGYRGFTIDSLPHMSVFDDVIITPEERHNFLNLSTFPEALQKDVQLIVTMGKMRGLPNPFHPEDLETRPDSPIVTYNYYVTYEFAKGERKEKGDSKRRVTLVGGDAVVSPLMPVDGKTSEPGSSQSELEANTHSTAKKSWTETIDCDYRKEHLTDDLVALKAYLLAGTTVSVVEEKVVSWPVVPTPDEKTGKKGKGKGKEKEKEKGKEKDKGKDKGKEKDTGKGGSKKKRKSTSPELRSDPPIVKVLGSSHVSLETLLAGASLLETVCDFGVQISERNATPPSPKDKEGKKGAKKDGKAKPGAESATSKRTPPPPTPSPVKGKGRKKDSSEGTDPQLSQPQPLTVEFRMQHIKWDMTPSFLNMLEAAE
ncbi:leucine-rich repeat-containing protein 43 [Erythrolamprus reginae]|uniref:leucine-rich repeat-containing protein 43 n=1 Tax=Erythrolamprus reginae TaxID=121349 RepID=UPI00396CD163